MNVKKLLIFADERIKIYDSKIDKMEYKLNDINNLIKDNNVKSKSDKKYLRRKTIDDHELNKNLIKKKFKKLIKKKNEIINKNLDNDSFKKYLVRKEDELVKDAKSDRKLFK
jgi:hypothetical protein